MDVEKEANWNAESIAAGMMVGSKRKITGLTKDGHCAAQVLKRQEAGEDVDGIYVLPSGRYFIVAGRWFSVTPRRRKLAAYWDLFWQTFKVAKGSNEVGNGS